MIAYHNDRKLLNIHQSTEDMMKGVIPDVSQSDRSWDVRSVHVSGKAQNMEAIGTWQSVDDLYLWGNGLKTIPESFYSLPLRSLHVTNNPLSAIDFARWAATLEHLTLRNLRCLSEIESIDRCPNLQILNLAELRSLTSRPTFSGLHRLTSLTLECFRHWPTVSGLLQCPVLDRVWLRKVSVMDDSLPDLLNRKGINVTLQP